MGRLYNQRCYLCSMGGMGRLCDMDNSEPHFSNACEWQCLKNNNNNHNNDEKKIYFYFFRSHNGINFQMAGTRRKSTQATQSDSNMESVLGQILTAIQGLAQASNNTSSVVQNMVQQLPGMVVGNGAPNSAAAPK